MTRIKMKPKTIFKDIEEFYSENPNRRYSSEIDYGCMWKDSYNPRQDYRISYVENTGEIYAVELAYAGDQSNGFVAILGVIPADERKYNRDGSPVELDDEGSPLHPGWYAMTLDEILDGWSERCGPPDGISWIKEKLRPHSYL